MKRLFISLSLVVSVISTTRAQYIPPDFYNEKYMPSIGFWENRGQVIDTEGNKRDDVKYYTTGSIPQAYLRTKSKVSFALHKVDTLMTTTDTIYHLQMQPWGEHAAERDPVGTVLKTSHLNYLLPHCGTNGITQVPGFSRAVYENIFPYIDLHFYSGGFGQKMAFVCRPGADPAHMILRFAGQDSLNQDLWGNLKFYHNGKYFVLPHAVAYQVNPNNTTTAVGWNAAYTADEDAGIVTFQWSSYDPTKPLVFLIGPPPAMGGGQVTTPGVCWSTYLGGDGGDRVRASDTDDEGNYYVGGFTYSQSIYFPIQTGQVYYEASPVAFVSKFGTGYESRWSTFYGGSFGIQSVWGLAVRPGEDPSIVIGGRTDANDLWLQDPQDGSYYSTTGTGGGGFLAELNHFGAAIWSTYFGNGSISVLNIDLHPTGLIAVCGDSNGPLPTEQDPAPPQAEHWNYAGATDGWIALLKSDRRTYWTTHIGGSGFDYLKSVRFGGAKVVALGFSESSNYPVQDGGEFAHDAAYGGNYDATLSEFTLEGDLAWSTYWGGSGGDQPGAQGLAVRSSVLGDEDVYVVGFTGSDDLPPGSASGWRLDALDPNTNSIALGSIARFSGADRSLLWHTYVHAGEITNGNTYLECIVADLADRIYIGGYTLTDGFPYQDAWQLYSTYVEYGAWDGVLMSFDPSNELRWSTRFGGEENNGNGERIETLCTWSDARLFAGGITYTSFSPERFFPFNDPVGDNDYFDDVFYPEWDAFLAAFCTDGLLTSVAETTGNPGFSAIQVAPGQFDLIGVPLGSDVEVLDSTGKLIHRRTGTSGDRIRIDLTREAAGIYVAYALGVGALKLQTNP
ncbi:MAG: hypothetical protein IPP83_15485 [Flavobacteriales bacterium]|nr:hypothetical protein [Flavobacteriales bacterium]